MSRSVVFNYETLPNDGQVDWEQEDARLNRALLHFHYLPTHVLPEFFQLVKTQWPEHMTILWGHHKGTINLLGILD